MTSYRATRSLLALLLLAACQHNAWLGMICPSADMRCDDAGVAAHSGAADAAPSDVTGSVDTSTSAATDGAVPPARSHGLDAQMPAMPDAARPDAATTASECRSVTINFFACASGSETPGAPRLQAGHAYTLRIHGDYKVDTTFQLQGGTAACTGVMLGTLTVRAGEPMVERCITASEDIAFLLTVMSGDVQVWMQNGLQVELCEGC